MKVEFRYDRAVGALMMIEREKEKSDANFLGAMKIEVCFWLVCMGGIWCDICRIFCYPQ